MTPMETARTMLPFQELFFEKQEELRKEGYSPQSLLYQTTSGTRIWTWERKYEGYRVFSALKCFVVLLPSIFITSASTYLQKNWEILKSGKEVLHVTLPNQSSLSYSTFAEKQTTSQESTNSTSVPSEAQPQLSSNSSITESISIPAFEYTEDYQILKNIEEEVEKAECITNGWKYFEGLNDVSVYNKLLQSKEQIKKICSDNQYSNEQLQENWKQITGFVNEKFLLKDGAFESYRSTLHSGFAKVILTNPTLFDHFVKEFVSSFDINEKDQVLTKESLRFCLYLTFKHIPSKDYLESDFYTPLVAKENIEQKIDLKMQERNILNSCINSVTVKTFQEQSIQVPTTIVDDYETATMQSGMIWIDRLSMQAGTMIDVNKVIYEGLLDHMDHVFLPQYFTDINLSERHYIRTLFCKCIANDVPLYAHLESIVLSKIKENLDQILGDTTLTNDSDLDDCLTLMFKINVMIHGCFPAEWVGKIGSFTSRQGININDCIVSTTIKKPDPVYLIYQGLKMHYQTQFLKKPFLYQPQSWF